VRLQINYMMAVDMDKTCSRYFVLCMYRKMFALLQ